MGEPIAEWFVHTAAKFLGMSFTELDDHPRKHSLMSSAFTLREAQHAAEKVWEAEAKQKADLATKIKS